MSSGPGWQADPDLATRYNLSDKGAGDKTTQGDTRQCQWRDYGVPESVFPDNCPLWHSLGSGQFDVLGVQHIEHRRPDQAHVRGHEKPPKGECRKQNTIPTLTSRRGDPFQLYRKEEDAHYAQPEGRHRLAEQRQDLGESARPGGVNWSQEGH